ncbi:MAG: preprotein translocase subunit SecE [Candidatus Dojkabacteria bacterium]|nr:MAG: preprotein translocase subunit SecE [Candidatus Dojkabacteria bacterium]
MKKLTLPKTVRIPWLGDIVTTFKAILWPTPKVLAVSLVAVLIISAIIGGYLWALDSGFEYLRNLILFN